MGGGGDDGFDSRGGDAVGAVASRWRVPWWRSLGMLMALPGLAFLMWVWLHSCWNYSWVGSYVHVTSGHFHYGYHPWRLGLSGGTVGLYRERAYDMSPGMKMRMDPPGFYYRSGGTPRRGQGLWGTTSWGVEKMEYLTNRMTIEKREWWCSFAFVVAGYLGAWMGAVALYRRRMKKRWEDAQVVEG